MAKSYAQDIPAAKVAAPVYIQADPVGNECETNTLLHVLNDGPTDVTLTIVTPRDFHGLNVDEVVAVVPAGGFGFVKLTRELYDRGDRMCNVAWAGDVSAVRFTLIR